MLCSFYYMDTDEIFPHKRQLFLFIFETAKSGHLLQNACHRNVMKLGYKVIKEK